MYKVLIIDDEARIRDLIKEYLDFMHLGFLDPAAKFFGAALALTETVLGTGLITGVWRRIIAPATIALQSAFTLITLTLVIFNPEMDCGCFGEAIHLTHWETFIKNLILICLLLIYYIPRRHLGETKRRKYILSNQHKILPNYLPAKIFGNCHFALRKCR